MSNLLRELELDHLECCDKIAEVTCMAVEHIAMFSEVCDMCTTPFNGGAMVVVSRIEDFEIVCPDCYDAIAE